jgi:hypothetical protein
MLFACGVKHSPKRLWPWHDVSHGDWVMLLRRAKQPAGQDRVESKPLGEPSGSVWSAGYRPDYAPQ